MQNSVFQPSIDGRFCLGRIYGFQYQTLFSEIMLEKFGKNILQEDFIKADSRTIWNEGPDVMVIVSGFQIDTIQMILHQGEIWFEYKIWQSLLVHPKKSH